MSENLQQQKQQLSAWLDGEAPCPTQHAGELDTELEQAWQGYHKIGDVLRNDYHPLPTDFSARMAAALADEPCYSAAAQTSDMADAIPAEKANSTVVALQPKPAAANESEPKLAKVVSLPWRKQVGQWLAAASVAAVAVIGVQHYSQQATADAVQPLPVFQTEAFGGVSPVSISTEPNQQGNELSLQQLQQQRVGALVLEHQRQTRMQAKQKTADNKE